jgi:hypothetical protein
MALLGVLLPWVAWAQSSLPFIFHSGATATGNGTAMQADYFSSIHVQVEGTFSGTVVFERKSKDGTNYFLTQCTNSEDGTKSTEAVEPGYWECPGGAFSFRVRVSAYTSGTIVVTGTGTTAVSRRGDGSGAVGIDQVMAVDRTYGGAVSQATGIRVGDDVSQEYTILFRDPTDGLISTCEKAGVLHDCDKPVKLIAGKKLKVLNASNAIIAEIPETGLSVFTTYKKICGGDLVALDPASGTAFHVWNKDPLATAPTATALSGTNRGIGVATFPDSDGDYGVQLSCELPTGFTGQLDAIIWWKTTGTGNARFQARTKCYAGDEADDASFNTASLVTAAAGTSGRPNRVVLSSITATGCAANELARFEFKRNRTEGSDTLNAALDVEKVEFWGWGQ